MRIIRSTVKTPFIRGGAELLAESLLQALIEAGHQAEIVQVPFKSYSPELLLDQMLSCRLLDLSESAGTPIDLLIGLKFPAYYIAHSNKVLWVLHQHRQVYDLWRHPIAGDLQYSPNGRAVQQAIIAADTKLIPEARAVYTISQNVSNRLERYCAIPSTPLYHPPPHADAFRTGSYDDYFFFPSRLNPIKRQTLVIDALGQTRNPACVVFAGAPDAPYYLR